MVKLQLKHEELDAICLALLQAQEYNTNRQTKNIYEQLRLKLRTKEPLSFSMKRLVKGDRK